MNTKRMYVITDFQGVTVKKDSVEYHKVEYVDIDEELLNSLQERDLIEVP